MKAFLIILTIIMLVGSLVHVLDGDYARAGFWLGLAILNRVALLERNLES